MRFFLAGINFSQTPGEIREKSAAGIGKLEHTLGTLSKHVSNGVILSTCNRIEVYTLADIVSHSKSAITDFLKSRTGLSDEDLLPYVYFYQGDEVVGHLFSVASGLESMIIGEYEILGQMGRALEEANEKNMVNLPLRNLFHQAIGAGRRVRSETGISRSALSVSSVAVEMAAKVVGDISQTNILVIGAGEAGRLVAKAAKERGASQLFIASRNREKIENMACVLSGKAISMDELSEKLSISDIIISCTAAPHFVLRYNRVADAMKNRRGKPMVIIDIAVPADVEPSVEQIDSVFRYDIDDFIKIAELNRQSREGEIKRATELVNEEVERFNGWWHSFEAKPTIMALIGKAEKVGETQMRKALKQMPDISDTERASLEIMTKSIVQKILHEPIQTLKKSNDKRDLYIQVINELFGLDKEK